MPRVANTTVPTCTHHKASGQAVVRLDGRDIYLGPWKSAASRNEYDRIITEWLASGRQLPTDPNAVTVAEVANAYRKFAKGYYLASNESELVSLALVPVLKLYGKCRAIELGPLAIQSIQHEMVRMGWCRTYCNRQTDRIKRMFKWAARQELVPAELFQRLSIVGGLPKGRCDAPESEPVKPVPVEHAHAVLPHVSAQVGAMIRIQLLTGMRPGEVCIMRSCDIDTTGKLWTYTPAQHKTAHHGHTRTIYLGPKAQEVIRPLLKPELSAYIFDPRDAEKNRREAQRQQRKTPLSCGNVPGSNLKQQPQHQPGLHYRPDSYRIAIARACKKAGIPSWHPHQLRHTAATELRRTHGLEAAQVILGHRTLTVTQVYAEKNVESAMRIMSSVG